MLSTGHRYKKILKLPCKSSIRRLIYGSISFNHSHFLWSWPNYINSKLKPAHWIWFTQFKWQCICISQRRGSFYHWKKVGSRKVPHFWMPLYEANCYILFGTLSKSKSWIWYQFNEKSSLKHSWNRYLLFSSVKSRVLLLKHVYDYVDRFHAKLTLFWLLIKDHMLRKKTSPIGYSFLRDIFIVLNSPARFSKKKTFRTFGSLLKFSSH